MATIKFALKMANGTEARTLDSLKENFSFVEVLQYANNGRLIKWLKDRNENELAEQIENLDKSSSDYEIKLCECFGIDADNDISIKEARLRNKKIEELRVFTSDSEILENVDSVAFEQKDIIKIIADGVKKVYLFGEKFNIPLSEKGITYVGVNDPIGYISSSDAIDFDKLNIKFANVQFDEKYINVLENEKQRKLEERTAHKFDYDIDDNGVLIGANIKAVFIIPDGVKKIGDSAFQGRNDIYKVIIPNSVTSIGNYAFSGCRSLEEVEIPNSVTTIGDSAFRDCSSLEEVIIPNSVTTIVSFAFSGCISLKEVEIPNSVTSIGNYAFCGCSSLEEVEIPNTVTYINNSTFSGNTNIIRK